MKKLLLLLVILLMAALPAYAQETSVTLTEDDVNAALNIVVENVAQVDELSVDFTDDVVVIDATVTTEEGETISVSLSMVVVPQEDGEGYYWEVSDATYNNVAVPQRTINEVNMTLESTEFRQFRTTMESNVLVNVTVDEETITYEVNEDIDLQGFEAFLENLEEFAITFTPPAEFQRPEGTPAGQRPAQFQRPEGTPSVQPPSDIQRPEGTPAGQRPAQFQRPEGTPSVQPPSDIQRPEGTPNIQPTIEFQRPEGNPPEQPPVQNPEQPPAENPGRPGNRGG